MLFISNLFSSMVLSACTWFYNSPEMTSSSFNPRVIVTNIVASKESLQYTINQIPKLYKIDPKNIIYLGDRFELPVRTIRWDSIDKKQDCSTQQHPSLFYQYLLSQSNRNPVDICEQEQWMASLINQFVENTQDRYEMIVDDSFWLYDETVFPYIRQKKSVYRLLQMNLDEDSIDCYPFFADQTTYFWNDHQTL